MPNPGRAVGDRPDRLHSDRLGDGPLVVLAEEDDGCLEGGGEDHGLVDVALAGGAVTEVGHRDRVHPVALAAHRVAGGVQGLGADDHGGRRHVDRERVPARVRGAAPHLRHVFERHPAHVGDRVLAVAREHEVVGTQRPGGSDLCRLLAEQRRPEAELALALEGGGFVVEAAHDDQVFVDGEQVVVAEVFHPAVVLGSLDSHAFRRQKLNRLVRFCGEFG